MKRKLLFRGTATALVTPFKRGGAVDEVALRELVDEQLRGKVEALVPVGSTGEAATLSDDEQSFVIETVVEQTKGRVPVIAGASSNSTIKAIALAKQVKRCGQTRSCRSHPITTGRRRRVSSATSAPSPTQQRCRL